MKHSFRIATCFSSFNVLPFFLAFYFGAVMRCKQIIYLVACHLGLPGLTKRQNNSRIKITIQRRYFCSVFLLSLSEVKNCPIFSHAMASIYTKALNWRREEKQIEDCFPLCCVTFNWSVERTVHKNV